MCHCIFPEICNQFDSLLVFSFHSVDFIEFYFISFSVVAAFFISSILFDCSNNFNSKQRNNAVSIFWKQIELVFIYVRQPLKWIEDFCWFFYYTHIYLWYFIESVSCHIASPVSVYVCFLKIFIVLSYIFAKKKN